MSRTSKRISSALAVCAAVLLSGALALPQQVVDREFKSTVAKPAYPAKGPTVAIDEAHRNFHTASGQYKPFADLLTSDGYKVIASAKTFDKAAFAGIDVLVIANATAGNLTSPAFTEAECDAVRDWVRDGGSLLLIADHAPYGTAAANLGTRFGITMGKGWAFDKGSNGITTQLVFSRENGLLGAHATLRGRDPSERVNIVRSFTGQSLGAPDGAAILLKLGPTAREAATTADLDAEGAASVAKEPAIAPGSRSVPVGGRAQAVALTFGQGKVVALGEAAMFSAQVVTLKDKDREVTFKAGMNAPGNDDRQFALNVLHWLTGLL